MAWHLFIPLFRHGQLVSYTCRSIGTRQARYQNASQQDEAYPMSHCLYGADLARHSVVVVEGPTDAWRVGPGAAAVMGLQMTEHQIAEIAKFPRRAICFDKSNAAQKKARWLCDQLAAFPGDTYRVVIETGDDPDTCDQEELDELRRRFLNG